MVGVKAGMQLCGVIRSEDVCLFVLIGEVTYVGVLGGVCGSVV